MNPFRVITLVLLSLAVILMFYVVVILVPERQSEYAQYQSTVRMNSISDRSNAHEARMQSIAPAAEQDSVRAALDKAEADEQRRKQELAEAEERKIIAAARAKEEAAREEIEAAATVVEAGAEDAIDSTLHGEVVLGKLASYDEEWAMLIIIPDTNAQITEGQNILIKRDGIIIAEATVNEKDEPSGQYAATLKQNSTDSSGEKVSPAADDIVVASPFESSEDLRNGSDANMPSLESLQVDQGSGLKELDADLIPMP